MYLLVINPGGTSTKVAVYEDKKEVLKKNKENSFGMYISRTRVLPA